jgi:hypothetical protein
VTTASVILSASTSAALASSRILIAISSMTGVAPPPDDRIKIVPYAEVRPSLGEAQLAPPDLAYYVHGVWGPLCYRKVVADEVFAGIPTIYLPNRPPLPGDYFVTQAAAIDQFMIRMKHSRCARNAVEYRCILDGGELAPRNWDSGAVDIPGVTVGFPQGVPGYPTVQ